MKLLHVIPEAPKRVGGIDGFLDGLNAALEKRGIEIGTLETARPLGELPKADVVHFHGLWQPAAIGLARSLSQRGQSYVVSPHGMLEPWAIRHRFWKKLPYFYLRESGFLKKAARLLATSELERASIRSWVSGSNPTVIPLGITERVFPSREEARVRLGWRNEDKVILFLSRLHPKKGLEMLMTALSAEPRLAEEGWRLVVVGDGEEGYVAKLRDLENRLPSLPKVDWIGAVWDERKWDYLAGADYFCLPSYSENFGLAVLEALASGTPVITTNATPWRDVADWPGCKIVSPDVAGLRGVLNGLAPFPDTGLRSELASRAIASFGWSRLAERYLDFYAEVCAK